jgi:hypothetical protein
MKLVIRSLVVLVAGCVLAVGCYFALVSLPTSALGGARGGHDGFRGQAPSGFAAGQTPENGAAAANAAAGAQPPAGAGEFGSGGTGPGGRSERGGREGRGGGSGLLGVFKDLGQIVVVTMLVVMFGWAARSLGGRRRGSAPDMA